MLNSKKVSDHHAIIPTMELAKTDLTMLPESERNILILTGARLLMATAEPHVYEAVTAVFLLRRPWLYGKRKDGNRCRVERA